VWGPWVHVQPDRHPGTLPRIRRTRRSSGEGQWLARVEIPYRNFTISLVGAAKTLVEYGGLPAALVYWPTSPTAEQQAIRTAAGRDDAIPSRPDNAPHFAAARRAPTRLIADRTLDLYPSISITKPVQVTSSATRAASARRPRACSATGRFTSKGSCQLGYSNLYPNPACVTSPSARRGLRESPARRVRRLFGTEFGRP